MSETRLAPETARAITAWLLAVLLLWAAAHALNRWLLGLDTATQAARFACWIGAKVVAWGAPTFVLLRHVGGASARWRVR